MVQFFLALVVVLVLIAGMSIGVIFGRKPISGSCGGVGSQVGGSCSVCGRDSGGCGEGEAAVTGAESGEATRLAQRAGDPRVE